jgi:hypothetical protein
MVNSFNFIKCYTLQIYYKLRRKIILYIFIIIKNIIFLNKITQKFYKINQLDFNIKKL